LRPRGRRPRRRVRGAHDLGPRRARPARRQGLVAPASARASGGRAGGNASRMSPSSTLPASMLGAPSAAVRENGGVRVAEIKDRAIGLGSREDPVPGLGQALIRVRAAGVNGADPVQVAGFYPPPPEAGVPEDVPGMELAGEVVESRAPVPRFE